MSAPALLSFHGDYRELALLVAGRLREAGAAVELNRWDGPPGVHPVQSAMPDLDAVTCVIALATPHGSAPGDPAAGAAAWIGDDWRRSIHEPAGHRGLPVFTLRTDSVLVPEFLRGQLWIDLETSSETVEVPSLLRALREATGDESIVAPEAKFVPDSSVFDAEVEPVLVQMGSGIADESSPGGSALLDDTTAHWVVDGLFHELGVVFPAARCEVVPTMKEASVRILLDGVLEREYDMPIGHVLVSETADVLRAGGFDATPAMNPANGSPAAWIPAHEGPHAEAFELTTWSPQSYLVLTLSSVLRNRAADYLTVSVVGRMVEQLRGAFPHLVDETIPGTASTFLLTDVLRRLVGDEVSIRDLRSVLMAVAEWGRFESDPLHLTEYVRSALKRYLSHKFTRGQNTLIVWLLDEEIESDTRSHIVYTATGQALDWSPESMTSYLAAVREAEEAVPPAFQRPLILTTMEIRPHLRRVTRAHFPHLQFLSYQELSPDMNIQPIGRISRSGLHMPGELRLDHVQPRYPAPALAGTDE